MASRENRARIFYLKAQDQNCFLFLPFVLAYSLRACVDLKSTEFAEFQRYGRNKIQVDASTETKKLIEAMAIRKGVDKNLNYLSFMRAVFTEGSLKPLGVLAKLRLIVTQMGRDKRS